MIGKKFGAFKVLLVPCGKEADEEGDDIGEGWYIGSFGTVVLDDGKEYDVHILAKGIHASEYSTFVPDANECAELLAEACHKRAEEIESQLSARRKK